MMRKEDVYWLLFAVVLVLLIYSTLWLAKIILTLAGVT